MPDAELLERFRECLQYQQAKSWQKPLLSPRRFALNQLRKFGLLSSKPGELGVVPTFHMPEFTIVQGEMISQEIASYSLFEPELTEAFLQLVQPGQVVVDIGMHLGYYATLFAVLVGPQGQVHAFEPTPSTRELALHNTRRFPQIRVHPLAMWSAVRTLALRDYGLRWMGFNTLARPKLDAEPSEAKEIEVQAITLDDFAASMAKDQKVALVKIDAESAERDIVRGGQQFLRQHRPLVSVEVGDRTGSHDSRLLVDDLAALGYAPWEFHEGQFSRHLPQESYTYGNLIFAPGDLELARGTRQNSRP